MRGLENNMQLLSSLYELSFCYRIPKGHPFLGVAVQCFLHLRSLVHKVCPRGRICTCCVGKSSAKKIIVGIFCTPKVDWRACALKVEHFNLLVGQLYVAVNQVFVRDLCSAHFATIAATTQNLKFQH